MEEKKFVNAFIYCSFVDQQTRSFFSFLMASHIEFSIAFYDDNIRVFFKHKYQLFFLAFDTFVI